MTAAAVWGGVLSSGDAATDPAVGMSGHRDGRRLGPEPLSSWSRPRRSPTAGAGLSNGGESAVGVAGRRVDRRGESCVDDGEGSRGAHQDRRGDLHRGRERDRSRRGPSRERVPSGGRRRGAGSDSHQRDHPTSIVVAWCPSERRSRSRRRRQRSAHEGASALVRHPQICARRRRPRLATRDRGDVRGRPRAASRRPAGPPKLAQQPYTSRRGFGASGRVR